MQRLLPMSVAPRPPVVSPPTKRVGSITRRFAHALGLNRRCYAATCSTVDHDINHDRRRDGLAERELRSEEHDRCDQKQTKEGMRWGMTFSLSQRAAKWIF